MRYASKTTVSSQKSLAEIELILKRYGAGSFMYANGQGQAAIMFEASKRRIKMTIPLPDEADFALSPAGRRWSKEAAAKSWDQAGRQRWRALALVVLTFNAALAIPEREEIFGEASPAVTLLQGRRTGW